MTAAESHSQVAALPDGTHVPTADDLPEFPVGVRVDISLSWPSGSSPTGVASDASRSTPRAPKGRKARHRRMTPERSVPAQAISLGVSASLVVVAVVVAALVGVQLFVH